MKYDNLGNTDLKVSKICLGTMTWGEQNTQSEAFEQLDYALDQGVNFIDTAEMYSVPARPETYGSTEKIIGNWINKRGKRDDFILATKAAGPAPMTKHIRGGANFSRQQLKDAVDSSLQRLQTDYIDLYQLHWPERPTNFFASINYVHVSDETGHDFREVLETLQEIIKSGKIRYVGLSNETPWGVSKYLQLSEQHGLPRMVSIQNPYHLLNRSYEVGLAEMSIRDQIGLLAYSPLAFGALTGKYLNGMPENSRMKLFPNFKRYTERKARKAVQSYVDIANEAGVSPTHLSLAYVNSRPFLTSNIIGATTMEQLKENISSIDVELSQEVIEKIDVVHKVIRDPEQ